MMEKIMTLIHLPIEGWYILSLMMFFLWIYQLKINNAGIVDIGWALGLMIIAGIYAVNLQGYHLRQIVLFVMVTLWGLRLVWLLAARFLREKSEDRRYQKFRQEWGENFQLKLLGLFLFEALLDLVLSVPFFLICSNPHEMMSFYEWGAVLVWTIGFLGEVISDEQLRIFKANPQNRHKVCKLGLWNFSRHPNYFFEWLMWVSYSLFALGSPYGYLGLLSPVIMYYFLIHVTGVPLAEEMSLQSKGEEYRQYQKTTSFFVPLPKRG